MFGIYGSEQEAQKRIALEEEDCHGMYGRFEIRPVYVGKSIDPAYSDETGYAYQVYVI